jgi:multidrug efflux pump subunit AcrB
MRGQVRRCAAYTGLLGGLAFAIVLVYLLIVVNFQSWLDPFIIITALPGALAGIVLDAVPHRHDAERAGADGRDHVHGRRDRQQHPGGQLRRERLAHGDAVKAAIEAGFTRFRPVLMTALAMIIGMMPMALGLGEGGEQNAPLGRAVIGGLLLATVATRQCSRCCTAIKRRSRPEARGHS